MCLLMLLCGARRPQFPWMTTGDQIEQTHQNPQNIQSAICICAYGCCHAHLIHGFIVSVILERLTQLEFRNIMQFHTPNQTQTPNFSIYFGKPWVSSAKNVNSVIIYMQNYCVASKDVVHQLHDHFYGVFLAASVYIYPGQSATDLLSTYVEESHVGLKCINDDRMHILAGLFLSMLLLAFLLIVQWDKGHDREKKRESGPDHITETSLDLNDFHCIDKES